MVRWLTKGGWGTWLLLVAVILLLAAPMLTYPLGRDQGEFAVIGSGILQGAVPYVDLWNPKPPAVFYIYAGAISVFGHNVMGLRALDLLLFPVMAAALYAIGKKTAGAAVGLWAVLLYGVFYFTETFWTLTQNDGIAAVPMALAVWCVYAVLNSNHLTQRLVWAAVCGALCALALWFKYPYALFVAALVIGYVSVARAWVWPEAAAFSVGGLGVGLGGLACLWQLGALGAWLHSAQVTAGYTAQGYDWGEFAASMGSYIGYRWQQWHLLWVLVGGQIATSITIEYTKTARFANDLYNHLVTDSRRWRIIGAWLVGTTAAMLAQAKGYDYHWLPMLPPLTLIGALAMQRFTLISSTWIRQFSAPLMGLTAIALLTLLAWQTWGTAWHYLTGQETRLEYYTRFMGGSDFTADESYDVASYLQANTAPGDTLFIWGFRPEVYYLSNMRPASRFIFQFPLVADWYPADWQQQNVDTLWASLPPYVLVLRGDFMPWVTGRDADSNMMLQDYTELNNWLIYNYEPDTQIGNFLVWRRKPQTTP